MRLILRISSIALLCSAVAAAQAAPPKAKPKIPPVQQTVVVVGTPDPVTLGNSQRSVTVLDTQRQPLAFATPEDYLRTDPSVLMEQRGAGGAQADISIWGSSFEQTLVLLNGLRINDAQTAHHDMDLPVPLEAMRSIDVLHGAGSTLYGSDAIGGVVDFLTATPTRDSLTLTSGAGSFGENEESAIAGLTRRRWAEEATGARNFSTGFMYDRDYRNENASTETRWKSALGTTDVLLAGSDRAFGANQFYGPYNSWERTKGWFGSARQEIGKHTQAAFGYRRHTDNFVLLRNDPSFYANNHVDESWEAVARRSDSVARGVDLYCGLEEDGDSIDSNNLGRHARNQGAGYADADLHRTRLWSLSAGARKEILSGGARSVFSPEVAGNLRVSRTVKVRASGGYGFRLPTYTDLYYSDPTTIGNAHLQPESAWSGDGGVDWYPTRGTMTGSLTVFYSRQHDAIDYVRTSATQPWQAENLTGLRFTGVAGSFEWHPTRGQEIQLGWTGIDGAQKALHGLESEYVFNYPVNNAVFQWMANLRGGVFVQTSVEATQRYKQEAYPVWNVDASWGHRRIEPWVRIANLSNTGYEEIAGVRMPGRSFTGGIRIALAHGQ